MYELGHLLAKELGSIQREEIDRSDSNLELIFPLYPTHKRLFFRVMDDLDLQSFQASVSRTEVDQVLRRIQGHPGVMALMLTNRDGLALRSNVDINTTKNYAVHYGNLIEMAKSAVRDLDPQNELHFIRFSQMAEMSDDDKQRKGRELWKALKEEPLNRRTICDLLADHAPTNFREPGKETKRTPLHYVIDQRGGDEELLDVLLKHEAGTNLVDAFKMTPLHLAAEKGNLQAVKKLIENASCPAELRPRNKNGETALDIAQRKGHSDVVSYLLEKLTGKISIKGDGGTSVSVSRQGPNFYVHVDGGVDKLMVGDHNKMEHNQ